MRDKKNNNNIKPAAGSATKKEKQILKNTKKKHIKISFLNIYLFPLEIHQKERTLK